jgi:hypothetical protein
VGGKTTGELRWEEPDERKGKEATGKAEENITELFRQGKHDQNRKPSRRGNERRAGTSNGTDLRHGYGKTKFIDNIQSF